MNRISDPTPLKALCDKTLWQPKQTIVIRHHNYINEILYLATNILHRIQLYKIT